MKPVVVASHPRSGTHLTIDTIRRQFPPCRGWVFPWETVHHLYLNLDRLQEGHPQRIGIKKAKKLLARSDRPLVKTHSSPRLDQFKGTAKSLAEQILAAGVIIYVVRDPRDVMCSAYLWRHPDPHERPSFSAFLREEKAGRNSIERWVDHVTDWMASDSVKVLKMEELISDPNGAVAEVGWWLGLQPAYIEPLLPEKNEVFTRWQDYKRRLLRNYESTAMTGRSRGETPPDWDEIASSKDGELLDIHARQIMRHLGYGDQMAR